jgi:hypothetical protein
VHRLYPILAAAFLFAGCGGAASTDRDQIRQAIQDQVRALRERNVSLYCKKTFSNVFLPARLAQEISVPAGEPGTTKAWDADYRACLVEFGKHGEFRSSSVPRTVTVRRVQAGGPADPASGISATAKAQVQFIDRSGKSLSATERLVKFRGDWKVLFLTN